MKKFNICLFSVIISIYLSSCGTIKEGFSSKKNDNSDEFLVEKKSPLLMPPDYNELPIPNSDNVQDNDEIDEIKELISKSKKTKKKSFNSTDTTASLEDLILGKIKNN